ncbi:hypothetical protein A3A76_05165 [Candidatus Woesebacteria bacterium RIFCSPLOWO2_01_FULL_39_23]|uniref:Uncharacterized protein n=2 Tax=Microgenomates group TaxID=1794810 RepID=A0A0H4TNS4_9BACT|nr:hypothetical protein [uncultured Microgenomates bacterium Rifle_16ft_4_minimus_37633]OGM13871.1 MAG: hypothetical protein A2141_04390 [Candidatus Woesebacteria bacterium RBG_16_40_11]OGM27823.1 MAG: hypothetical protein A2628_05385 [Candidatus Woesebacteria bacterium RIFCSPHIGHO2_01_FULL_40_22]OGM36067.1 MAG: hypothetical protein A3E41_04510 [Candidatus Woesebacteria bacterium RIFCSPHIGHO2_12_FULL_38_9]OGM62245.1 MAG: hypothetical protein A3A76_05165 [Candidatus Woesebacteria bacterium RIFCS
MSREILTGRPLYRKIIENIVNGSDSPDIDIDAFEYHVQHTFNSLMFHIRFQRQEGEKPNEEDVNLLKGLLSAVPKVLDYFSEDRQKDLKNFLISEGIIKDE